jgi:hypothetical protein
MGNQESQPVDQTSAQTIEITSISGEEVNTIHVNSIENPTPVTIINPISADLYTDTGSSSHLSTSPSPTTGQSQSYDSDEESPIVPRNKSTKFVHPFIDLINRRASSIEMIDMLNIYCGCNEIGTDDNGNPIYEAVDQFEFLTPGLDLFAYCANNGRTDVVRWFIDKFVPLQVSYDNNYCFFECQRWGHYEIADMIANHDSFVPSFDVFDNLISRSKYSIIRKCLLSPHINSVNRELSDIAVYRYTMICYLDANQTDNFNTLYNLCKRKFKGENLIIPDEIKTRSDINNLVQSVQQISSDIIVDSTTN